VSNHEAPTLEALVDRIGLARVLLQLDRIATEKSTHILNSWQDRRLSDQWIAAARALNRLANTESIRRVS
jgi:hypothetical protein